MMTPEEAREAAAVMIAWAEGKQIEFTHRSHAKWETLNEPSWSWDRCDYRIAPEPWTGKIWVHADGRVIEEEDSEGWNPQQPGWRLITAKEVGDE